MAYAPQLNSKAKSLSFDRSVVALRRVFCGLPVLRSRVELDAIAIIVFPVPVVFFYLVVKKVEDNVMELAEGVQCSKSVAWF